MCVDVHDRMEPQPVVDDGCGSGASLMKLSSRNRICSNLKGAALISLLIGLVYASPSAYCSISHISRDQTSHRFLLGRL